MSEKLYYIDVYMHIVFFFYFVNIKGTVNVIMSGRIILFSIFLQINS